MSKVKRVIWGVVTAALIAASAIVYTPSNRYERAQRETVLLATDDGQGSGVVVKRQSEDGTRLFIWTAAHVVEGFDHATISYFIRYEGERVGRIEFQAQVIARDKAKDIALLWLHADPKYFGAAKFDVGHRHHVGDYQYHVGNFLGETFDGSVSIGVISQIGVRPNDPQWPWGTLDQTTCAAIFGSSGGPVFDSDNEVCGLIVGGMVGKGFIEYVPTREIVRFAKDNNISWAVMDYKCPADRFLQQLAQSQIVQAKATLTYSVDDP